MPKEFKPGCARPTGGVVGEKEKEKTTQNEQSMTLKMGLNQVHRLRNYRMTGFVPVVLLKQYLRRRALHIKSMESDRK